MARTIGLHRTVMLAAGLPLILAAAPAKAGGDANAAKAIIQEHCADCHAVPGYESERRSPAIEALPLAEIAADPATYSEERLRGSLRKPHWPMEQFRLSAQDIENILAFIESLRGQ